VERHREGFEGLLGEDGVKRRGRGGLGGRRRGEGLVAVVGWWSLLGWEVVGVWIEVDGSFIDKDGRDEGSTGVEP